MANWIRRLTLPFYLGTALLYVVLIPLTMFAFPNTTLTLTMIILITGFLAALGTLGDALVAHEQNKSLESIDDEVSS